MNVNPSKSEVCGNLVDDDCSSAAETYFNVADLSAPNGFCTGASCCNNAISLDEVLTSIGKFKATQFTMTDLLATIGKYKIG